MEPEFQPVLVCTKGNLHYTRPLHFVLGNVSPGLTLGWPSWGILHVPFVKEIAYWGHPLINQPKSLNVGLAFRDGYRAPVRPSIKALKPEYGSTYPFP